MESFLSPFKEMLVRPPRTYYTKRGLGPANFKLGVQKFVRKDFSVNCLINFRG